MEPSNLDCGINYPTFYFWVDSHLNKIQIWVRTQKQWVQIFLDMMKNGLDLDHNAVCTVGSVYFRTETSPIQERHTFVFKKVWRNFIICRTHSDKYLKHVWKFSRKFLSTKRILCFYKFKMWSLEYRLLINFLFDKNCDTFTMCVHFSKTNLWRQISYLIVEVIWVLPEESVYMCISWLI